MLWSNLWWRLGGLFVDSSDSGVYPRWCRVQAGNQPVSASAIIDNSNLNTIQEKKFWIFTELSNCLIVCI